MTAKTFSKIPGAMDETIERMARAAPGGSEVMPPAAQPEPVAESTHRPDFPRRREPTQTMNLRVPLSLFTELRAFMRESEIPMTEIMVAGARKELAALKKKYGIE